MKKEKLKCVCGTWTKPKMFRIEGFQVRGSECPKCGESYLNPDDAYRLSEYRKIKDAVLDAKVAMAGNSFVVRLPIELVRAMGLKKGETVHLSVSGPHEVVVRTDG